MISKNSAKNWQKILLFFSSEDEATTERPVSTTKDRLGKLISKVDARPKPSLIYTTESTPGMQSCPFEYKSEYQTSFKHVKPLLNSIRRDHFLLNLSPFGPNNQLRGFRDSLVLSIYLNRTVVIPSFFKHRTDPSYHSGSTYQDGQQKIDGLKLAEFVPTITMKEYGGKCLNGMDVVYLARKSSNSSQFSRVQTYEQILGFSILNRDRKVNKDAMIAPTVINPEFYAKKTREEVYISPNKVAAEKAFGKTAPNSNDGPCAMWQEVYRNMLLLSPLGHYAARKDPDFKVDQPELDDLDRLKLSEEIVAKAVLATPRPRPVRDAASEFRQAMQVMTGNKTYVALHWRYDPGDFGKHCHGSTHGVCGALSAGVPAIVGKNIGKFVLKLIKKNQKEQKVPDNLKSTLFDPVIYIAAPTNQWDRMEEMKVSLKKENIDVVYGRDLNQFLRNRYSKCPKDVLDDELLERVRNSNLES